MSETVSSIVADHRAGTSAPEDTVGRSYARIRAYADPAVFITLRDEADAIAEARGLVRKSRNSPLYGIPVAVKDNIDVAGLPTTAACPGFSYLATQDAAAIAKLRAAGAIIIGKTNLDQFATGLVGTRSPYGVPRNPFNAALIPGGSSAGSAVAVAAGLVPLALGTDTAGSGRVPAGLNNIVGLKPSIGLVSTAGVVPACRSLDCVSIFTLTVEDAHAALTVVADQGGLLLGQLSALPPGFTVAVPRHEDLLFFGDRRAERSFEAALELLDQLGVRTIPIDFRPFLETGRLLYEGPWVAERFVAVGDYITRNPNEVHPVTREIIGAGADLSAAEAFRVFYRLSELRGLTRQVFVGCDAVMVPTAPAAYTVAEIEADPIRLNSNLGTYTNFVNLLDLAGIAVPVAFAEDKTPFGVTFLAPSGHDVALANLARVFHARTGLPLGALGVAQPPLPATSSALATNEIAVAVVGAHLSGMPLNGELRDLGARFIEATTTTNDYCLFALAGTTPAKPGLLRVAKGKGSAIEVEIWALSTPAFGKFVASVASPLSIGTLQLADGRGIKGFLVEAEAISGARDISEYGGWRNFVASNRP